jgi:hypothetical protein
MQTSSEEAANQEIDEGMESKRLDQCVIKDQLNHNVEEMPHRKLLRVNKSRAKGVEENLERPGGDGEMTRRN